MHIKTNRIVFSGLLIASFLLSSNLGISSASAASATITTNTDITLNASSAGNGVTIDEESIGITTTCNKGYNLTIATSTSTDLYLNGDSTKTAAYTAVDGTSALDSTNNTNKWGYTLTNNATSSTVFFPLSTTASSIRTISQTNNVTSETIPIYYGIKTDNTVDPGTYSMGNNGTITYYLTMNPLCNVVDIAYDGNNADAGTMGAAGTGVIHTGKKDGDTIDLIASNFSREGYGFAGWSLDPDAGTKLLDNDNTNNPIVYGPQESITLPEGFIDNDTDNDGIIKLYAVWLQSQGNLQGWMGCSNLDTATYDSTTGALDLTKNSVIALTDMRDHDTYAVARLADGNCWMIENLRLEAEDTRGNNRFDSSITNESLAQGYGTSTTYGNFSGLADAESTGFSNTYSANSLYSNDGSNDTINIGTSDDPAYRMPRYNNLNTPANTNDRPQNPTRNTFTNKTTVGMYSYGNYYTWHAAIADLTYNSTNNSSVTNTSLCPSGWHLPIGGRKANVDVSDFWKLSRATIGADPANFADDYFYYTGTPEGANASNKMRAYPNNFLYSGYFHPSSTGGRGTDGYYWSSTAHNSYGSYYLYLGSSVHPGTYTLSKYYGFSIRCTVPSNLYAVHFDANTTDTVTGTMANQAIAVDEAAQLNSNSFRRPATSSAAYRFVKWNTEPDGSGTDYADGASVTNLAAVGQTITLYAQWEQVTPMTVNFNGNGLSFDDSSTTNTVYYANYDCVTKALTKYSHTPNMDDSGNQNGNYPNNANLNEVITIPGASKLHIALTYEGESTNYDWVSFWEGNYPSYTAGSNYSTGVKWTGTGSTNGKYGGTTKTTLEGDINGDTVTFAFKSDGGGVGGGYGYYAVITGLDSNGDTMIGPVCSRSLVTGDYKTPVIDSLHTFYGWSENQSATTADYATADKVLNNLPGNNGETKTLYAIWKNNLTINYNANGGTGTTASQTVAAGETIRLKSNNFTAPSSHKQFRNWNTAPDGSGISYSANSSFTAPTNVNYNESLMLYAIWDDLYYIAFNANESSVDSSISATGTMTNQAVIRDAATTIKTNTFALAGYVFYGWNTKSDGTGVYYSNGQSITNIASAGETITLYAVWKPPYTISYNINGGNEGTMGNQTKADNNGDIAEGSIVTLLASNFSREGYGFVGWSIDPDAASNQNAKIYGPQETITAPAYPENGILILYAIWLPSAGSLQDATKVTELCGANGTGGSLVAAPTDGTANIASVSALTDQRDNETYAIARLADGNCWMIENLRLESTNNDNSTGSLAQGYGISATYGNFSGLADAESTGFSATYSANSLYSNDGSDNTINIGTGGSPGYRMPRYNNLNTPLDASNRPQNPNSNTFNNNNTLAGMYSYGNYYTWHAAIADTTYNSTNNKTTEGTSLCPKGWKLPKGGDKSNESNNDFWSLIVTRINGGTTPNNYGNATRPYYDKTPEGENVSNKLRAYPNNFILSGGYGNASPNSRGYGGYYWSSTATNYASSYYLMVLDTRVFPGTDYSAKSDALSIRCMVESNT